MISSRSADTFDMVATFANALAGTADNKNIAAIRPITIFFARFILDLPRGGFSDH